jgi:hypothetical protein
MNHAQSLIIIRDEHLSNILTILTVFVIYNIYNNYIINNKIDEIKILKIRMTARHYQWRVTKMPLTVASFIFFFSFFLKKTT